jgi:uncharacterized protein YdaU (DUF1376 family)
VKDERTDLPWFKFHVGDYLRTTRGWPPVARLCYVELLAAQWDRGALPVNPSELRALILKLNASSWAACWPLIETAFPIDGDARRNQAFKRMRDKQLSAHASRRNVAKKAALERWRERTGVDASSTSEDA